MLRDDYLDWKAAHFEEPFTEDGDFFRERYGTTITPLCKDLFRELMLTHRRLCQLEGKEKMREKE